MSTAGLSAARLPSNASAFTNFASGRILSKRVGNRRGAALVDELLEIDRLRRDRHERLELVGVDDDVLALGDLVALHDLVVADLLTGLVVFVVASMLAGRAPTGGLLIGARLLQGLGGAMILPSTSPTKRSCVYFGSRYSSSYLNSARL